MPINMSYCWMENTFHALKEAQESLDEVSSPDEWKARNKLVKLCREIAEDYENEIENGFDPLPN